MRPARPLLLAALAALAVAACGGPDSAGGDQGAPSTPAAAASFAPGCHNEIRTCMAERTTPPPTVIDAGKSYSATLHTSRGDFTVKLDPKAAPVTVNNFVYLSENSYYSGLTFHRREEGFVIQGGDPLGNGTGGPGYKLPDETNPAPWVRGSVAMASSSQGVSGSQFFVLLGDAPHLARAGVFNHFGKVTAGLETVDAIKVGDRITSISIAAT